MKKMLFIAFLLSFSINLLAQEKIYSLADFPKEKRHFDMVGKKYIAKRDNEYLIEKFGISNLSLFRGRVYAPLFFNWRHFFLRFYTASAKTSHSQDNQNFLYLFLGLLTLIWPRSAYESNLSTQAYPRLLLSIMYATARCLCIFSPKLPIVMQPLNERNTNELGSN